ncbi:MAG TPA: hypothetical protein VFP40_18610 [Terriglobales bacterium]|jgi:hypothetical protein|nr:hypothetical protein [Terriglobales bacterium]
MPHCEDERPLSELDPVTFFIVTELMVARRENQREDSAEPVELAARQAA